MSTVEDIQKKFIEAVETITKMQNSQMTHLQIVKGKVVALDPIACYVKFSYNNHEYFGYSAISNFKIGEVILVLFDGSEDNNVVLCSITSTVSGGKSISDLTMQYYLSNSNVKTDIPESDPGWVMTEPTPTTDKPYIWTRVIYVYSDGEVKNGEKALLNGVEVLADQIQKNKQLIIVLDNENQSISTDNNGENGDYSNAKTSIKVYYGSEDVTSTSDISFVLTNVIGSYNSTSYIYTVINLTTDSGNVAITATYTPANLPTLTTTKIFSLSKARAGTDGTSGTSGKVANILATAQVFKSMDGGATFTPDLITLTPSLQSVAFSKWQYSVDGGLTWIDAVTGVHGITISDNILTLSENSDLYTDTITSVVIKLTTDDSTVYDTETIVRLLDATSANIQIGGRNLFLNSAVNQKNITFWTLGDVTAIPDLKNTYQGLPSIQITKGTTSVGGIHNDSCVPVLQGGKTYTWSFMVKTPVSFTPSGNKLLAMQLVNGTDLHCEVNMKYYPATVSANVWTKVWVTFDAPILHDTYSWDAYIWYLDNNAVYNVLNFKLEEGNSPTDWTPAPNDVQIKDLITEYYLSTSATDLVDGSWETYFPTTTPDTYLWKRTTISYTDDSTIISTPVLDNASNQFFNVIQTNTTNIQQLDGRITSQVTAITTVTTALTDKQTNLDGTISQLQQDTTDSLTNLKTEQDTTAQALDDYKNTVTSTYALKSEIAQTASSITAQIEQAVKTAETNTITTLATTVVDARGFTVSTAGDDTHTTIDGAGVMVKDAQNNDVANFKASGSEIQKLKVINDVSVGAHNTQAGGDYELNEDTMKNGDYILGSADFWIGDVE